MGTNFYLATKNRDLRDEYFGNNFILTDIPDWGYEIHIAKTSCGWKPLFQAHPDAFKSVAELKALYESGGFVIYDEYQKIYNWESFVERVVNWNKDPFKLHDGRLGPISHFDKDVLDPYWSKYYYKDPDGYEFVTRDFS